MYGHLFPISQTIQVKGTRYAKHCWRNRDELKNELIWTHIDRRASIDRPAKTSLHQLCKDTRCRLEDLPGVIDDWEGW